MRHSENGEQVAHGDDNDAASSNPFAALGSTFASFTLADDQGNDRETSSNHPLSVGGAFPLNEVASGCFNPFLSLGDTSATLEATAPGLDKGISLPPLGSAFPPLQPVTSFNAVSACDVATGHSLLSYSRTFSNPDVAAGIAAVLFAVAEWKDGPAPNVAELHGTTPIKWIEALLRAMVGVPTKLPISLGTALLSEFFLSGCEDVALLQSLLACLRWNSICGFPSPGDLLYLLHTISSPGHPVTPDSHSKSGNISLPDIEPPEFTFDWMIPVLRKQELFLGAFMERLGPKSCIFERAVSHLAVDDRIEAFGHLPWAVFSWVDEPPIPDWPFHVNTIMNILTGAQAAARSSSLSVGEAQTLVDKLVNVILCMLLSSMREHKSVSLLQELLETQPGWARANLRDVFGEVVNAGVEAGPSFFVVLQESPLFDVSLLTPETLVVALTNRHKELATTVLQYTSVVGLLQRPTKTSTVPLLVALNADWDYSWILEIFEKKSVEFPLTEPLLTSIRSHSGAFYAVCATIARMSRDGLLIRLLDIAEHLELEVAQELLDVLNVRHAWACSLDVLEAILLHVKGTKVPLQRVGSRHSLFFEALDSNPGHHGWPLTILKILGPTKALEPEPIASFLTSFKRGHLLGAISFLLSSCEQAHFDAPGQVGNNVLHALASLLPELQHHMDVCTTIRQKVSDCLTTQRNDYGLLPIDLLYPSPRCTEDSGPYQQLKRLLTPVTYAKRA